MYHYFEANLSQIYGWSHVGLLSENNGVLEHNVLFRLL